MKSKSTLLLSLFVITILAACSGRDDAASSGAASSAVPDGTDLSALVTAAEDEGQVVVYSFTSRIARVEAAFEAAYPEIDLVGFDISSTEQIARLQAEHQAGNVQVDVAYISDAPVVFGELVRGGVLQRYVPPQFEQRVPDRFKQPLLANRLSTKVLMYNEEAHPDGAPVDNLWELTTDEWTGRVLMVDPLIRGDYLDLMTQIVMRSDEMETAYQAYFGSPFDAEDGVGAGERFIVDLFANDLILVGDTDDVNAAVGAIGQENPPVGITSYSDRRDNEEEGWALQIANDVQPSPGIYFPASLGIVDGAPNPAAARLFIHFMMGDESSDGGAGYAPFYVPGDYATRTDITPHPDAIPLDRFNAWYVDPEETLALRSDVADLILSLE